MFKIVVAQAGSKRRAGLQAMPSERKLGGEKESYIDMVVVWSSNNENASTNKQTGRWIEMPFFFFFIVGWSIKASQTCGGE